MATSNQHTFSILAKADTVYCVVRCQAGMAELTKAEIIAAFQESSFTYHQLESETLDSFIEQVNTKTQAITELQSESEVVKFPLAKAIDAHLEIKVQEDKMRGIATLTAARGGKPISAKQIKQVCITQGIKYGLKAKLVEELISKARRSVPGSVIEQIIVIGKPVKNGEDAYILPKVTLFSEVIRTPTVYSDGSFDMRDLGNIQSVAIGQVVAEKITATQGEYGIDVMGTKIAPTPGADFELQDTESTQVSKQNPNYLVATKQGLLRQEGNKVVVDDIFKTERLTAREGHIKFDGSVIVDKDVEPDMKIEADGDVFIGGFVQSGTIICSGDLTIVGGSSGKKLEESAHNDGQQMTCHLKAKNISISFASSSELIAEQQVVVNKQLTNCDIQAKSLLIGDEKNPRGKILGGKCYLSESLSAGEIGNELDIQVDIDMNRELDLLAQQDLKLWQKLEMFELQKIELATNSEFQLDSATVESLKLELKKLIVTISKLERARYLLAKKRNKIIEAIKVTAHQAINRNVTVKIAEKSVTFDEKKGASRVTLENYEMITQPL